MNTIQEQANSYADQVAGTIIHEAIKKAYLDGFNEGIQVGKDSAGNAAQISEMEEYQNSVSFIDLDLPSGTLWSDDYMRDHRGNIVYLSAEEAAQFNIPTLEQMNEFLNSLNREQHMSYTDVQSNSNGIFFCGIYIKDVRYLARNSYIIQKRNGFYDEDNEFVLSNGFDFWIRAENEIVVQSFRPKNSRAEHYELNKIEIEKKYFEAEPGYRYPIRLVKTKEE